MMLEGPSFLIARDLPSSCEQETEWIYNSLRVMELANNKRRLELEAEAVLRKARRLSEPPKERQEGEPQITILDLSLSLKFNQGTKQNNAIDELDSDALIRQLGRDISINCILRCSRTEYGKIALLNKSFRSLIRSGEIYRLRRQVGRIEHWVYFSSNLPEWEAFDPDHRRWMQLPRMPSNECFICSDKESLAVGTDLLVFGKEIMSPVINRYSLLTNKWSSGMRMNVSRCLFGSASLGEVAILAGGCDPRGKILSSAELYNSETKTWELLPDMNKARKMCSGVFIGRKFYVLGGIGIGNLKQLTCGEEFDLETRKWREIPNMYPRRPGMNEISNSTEAPPLIAVVNNVLYAADYSQQVVRRYQKDSNSWVTVGRLPERVASMNGWGLAFRACGNQLIVLGGPRAMTLDRGVIEVNACFPGDGELQWNMLASKQSATFVYNCAVMGC